jgi:ATPase family associated with various cellular activities (AAA)
MVNAANWRIENYVLKATGGGQDRVVDVALIAARRLSRSAGRVGFANARSVRVMFESMQRAASLRQKQEKRAPGWVPLDPEYHSMTLTLIDLIGHPMDLSASPLVKELMAMTGLADVKKSVRALLEITVTNYDSELRGEEVLDVSLNRMFLGNPGTGKTTVAGLYGRILVSLGYLTNGEVIVVGASELMGAAVGTTAKTVNDLMDNVSGKVLVIDEAYVLGSPNSPYGKEALDTLVERVQGSPGEDFAVIMCGYEDEMKTMLRDCNPGLKRRFKSDDAFMFADYSDEELAEIMVKRAQVQRVYVTQELAESCVRNVLAKQKAKQHFGNVGSVNNLLESAKEKMMQRYCTALITLFLDCSIDIHYTSITLI